MAEHTTRAVGKKCTRCLCCPAVISFAGEDLCAACDDGTHPPPPESHRAPAIELPAPILEPIEENETMTIRSGRPHGVAIPIETKRAVLAEPASRTNAELARKYKISDVTVGTWRKAAGIAAPGRRGKRGPYRKTRHAAAAEAASAKARSPEDPPSVGSWRVPVDTAVTIAPPVIITPGLATAYEVKPEQVAATVQVNRAMLDGWWRRLTLAEKAALFAGELRIRVEGFVS